MKRLLYIFIAFVLLLPKNVFAEGENVSSASSRDELNALIGQLNQGPSAKNISVMDDADMDFANSTEDAFTTEPNPDILPVIPMLQKNNQTSNTPQQNKTTIKNNIKKENVAPKQIEATLTDTLQKQDKESLPTVPLPDVSGTWVDKLAESVPLSVSGNKNAENNEMPDLTNDGSSANESLRRLVDGSKLSSKRSNASVFDISGIMLRMNVNQADKAMMMRGFKKISQNYEIPNFIKWRNEEKCRGAGVVGYERLMNCVVKLAKQNNHQYVETVKYSKFSSKEEVEIKLTSNFTNNKVYRIIYKSMSGKVVGSGAKAAYLRNIKVFDFWKKVNQKYGTPDNKDEVMWGLGNNKPYMKASTGFLMLEDPMLRELDYTRMSREDQRFMNTDLYSF